MLPLLVLGLIGGSMALGIRHRQLAESVTAWDSNPGSLATGLTAGLIDRAGTSLEDAVQGVDGYADLVVLSGPVATVGPTLKALHESGVTDETLITDVGSVKATIIEAAREVFGQVPGCLVPGHPIAGSEKSGVVAAEDDLFRNHQVILTPLAETDTQAVHRVSAFWQALGARVEVMAPDRHDVILAQTSHLPHLLAYALVDSLSAGGDSLEVFRYAAGGFRDFSRIAASDPTIWRDIIQANDKPVLAALDRYLDELGAIRQLINLGDVEALETLFRRAKSARDYFAHHHIHHDAHGDAHRDTHQTGKADD